MFLYTIVLSMYDKFYVPVVGGAHNTYESEGFHRHNII